MDLISIVDSIAKHEGFRDKPYIDPLVRQNPENHGIPQDEFQIIEKHFDKLKVTFGYGFTNITEVEAKEILKIRVQQIHQILIQKIPNYKNYPSVVQDVLVEMAFQIGWPTLLKFRHTLQYLDQEDYNAAADEMLDSRWARQTRARATELSNKVRALA